MKSVLESRSFYHWHLSKRGGLSAAGSLIATACAGLIIVASHRAWRPLVAAPGALVLAAFLALMAAAILLWWHFSRLQDEMFHKIQNYSFGRGALLTVAVLILWGLANLAALAPPISPITPLVIFVVAKSFFWTRAVRTWL